VALWALRAALRALPPEVAAHHLERTGLEWAVLDADLARMGRTARVLLRAGFTVGQRVLGRVGGVALRAGLQLLDRTGLPRRLAT
jgi:hypothetical protein